MAANESCGDHGGGSRANRNGSGRVAAQLHDAREVLLDGCPGVLRHIVGRAIDLVDRHFLRAVAAAGIGFTLRVHETWSASTALSSDRNAHVLFRTRTTTSPIPLVRTPLGTYSPARLKGMDR